MTNTLHDVMMGTLGVCLAAAGCTAPVDAPPSSAQATPAAVSAPAVLSPVSINAEMEITAFERNRMYTITHHKAGVRIDTTFWFEASGGGTKVTVEFDLDSSGLPPGLLAPLGWAIAGKIEKVLSHDLADLKRSVAP